MTEIELNQVEEEIDDTLKTGKIKDELSKLAQQTSPEKKEYTSMKEWVLDFTSIQGRTNALILAARFFLFLFLTTLLKYEVARLNDLGTYNPSGWRYGFIAVLMFLIYLTFIFERMNNEKGDQRKKEDAKDKMVRQAQLIGLLFSYHEILPNLEDLNDQISMIKTIPTLISMISIDEVVESMRTGFEIVADSMTNIRESFSIKSQEIQHTIGEKLDEMLASITPSQFKAPRPKMSPISVDKLIPDDDDFPSSEDLDEEDDD